MTHTPVGRGLKLGSYLNIYFKLTSNILGYLSKISINVKLNGIISGYINVELNSCILDYFRRISICVKLNVNILPSTKYLNFIGRTTSHESLIYFIHGQ